MNGRRKHRISGSDNSLGDMDEQARKRHKGMPDLSAHTDDNLRIITHLGAALGPSDERTEVVAACLHGNLAILRELHKTNVLDFTITVHNKTYTTLMFAVLARQTEVIRFLVEEVGVDVDAPGQDNFTALSLAAWDNELEIVKYLVDSANANVNMQCASGRTPLALAAVRGHLAVVNFLLAHPSAVVDMRDNTGFTPLALAASAGYLDVVKALVRAKANVNATDLLNRTVLFVATMANQAVVVQWLLANTTVDVERRDKEGLTALLVACYDGRTALVRSILESPNFPHAKQNPTGPLLNTPLNSAAVNGHEEVVSLLLEHFKASVDQKDALGRAALYVAAGKGHINIVRVLLRFGANVDTADIEGRTPLMTACVGGHLATARCLVFDGKANVDAATNAGRTALILASYSNREDVVRFLVSECHASVEAQTKNGRTALMIACYQGHLGVARFLVSEAKANIETRDNDRCTPLYMAAQEGQLEIVRLLVGAGANVEAESSDGTRPIHAAAMLGRPEVVKFLVREAKADPNTRDVSGHTPLWMASFGGDLEIVRFLVNETDGRVDIEAKNNKQRSSLYIACCMENVEIVKFLVRAGANVHTQDHDKYSPLHIAAYHGRYENVVFLVEHGKADVSACDSDNGTPLHLACQGGHTKVVKYLVTKAGANTAALDIHLMCPLLTAVLQGHINTVKWLVGIARVQVTPPYMVNAYVNQHIDIFNWLRDHNEWTRLMVAVDLNDEDEVKQLLLSGEDPFYQSSKLNLSVRDVALRTHVIEPIRKLVDDACQPWSEATNYIWPRKFKNEAVLTLLLKKHVEEEQVLPTLPEELWRHVLQLLSLSHRGETLP